MGLLNLRNALMAGKRLPYDAEVEYLESTGTQYIDTGVAPNDDTFEMNITFMALAYNDGCCGTFAGGDDSNCYLNFWGGGVFVRKDGYSSNSTDKESWNNGGIYFPNGWNNIQLASDIVINGHIVQSNIPKSPRPNAFNALLFAYHRRTNIQAFSTMRISKCVIKVNGVVAFDAVPVRKGTVGYLYDRVTGNLFGNAGTGDFVIGPDVVPVEYIESHGTEYIDTGIKLTSNDVVDITASRTNNNSFFGSSETSKWFNVTVSSGNTMFRFGANTKRAPRPADGQVSSMSCGRKWIVDGTEIGTESLGDFASSYNCGIFARIGSVAGDYLSGRVYKFDLTTNGTKVMGLLPVRVGTEGAMIDTLTRRIYRNAGTGAFTYGNDLKYPIPAE